MHAPAKKSKEPQWFVGEQERLAGAGRASGLWECQNPRERTHERVVLCAGAREPSVERQLGLSEQEKWLVLPTLAVERAGEMVGELAEDVGAEAEVPVVPSQGRHLK